MDRKKRKIKLPWWVPYSVPVIIFAEKNRKMGEGKV